MKILALFCIGLFATLLSSCTSTPLSRIQKNPTIYAQLNARDQNLVQQGRITNGMTKPAVYLAMGHPDNKLITNRDGKMQERWDYYIYRPVYSHRLSPYFNYAHGGYRRSKYYGAYFQPTIRYAPHRGTSVHFKQDQVTGWDQVLP